MANASGEPGNDFASGVSARPIQVGKSPVLLSSFFAAAVLAEPPKLTALRVEPSPVVLEGKCSSQTISVTVRLSDGSTRDLTAGAEFASANTGIADVDKDGVVRAVAEGATSVMMIAKLGDFWDNATRS